MTTSNRVAIGIVFVLATLLVVAGIATAGFSQSRLPDGSPEAAVQGFYAAIVDGRPQEALDYLTPELRSRCDIQPWLFDDLSLSRVVLEDVQTSKSAGGVESARVEVRITQTWDDAPLVSDDSTFSERVFLERADGSWSITESPWPFFCNPKPTPPLPEEE